MALRHRKHKPSDDKPQGHGQPAQARGWVGVTGLNRAQIIAIAALHLAEDCQDDREKEADRQRNLGHLLCFSERKKVYKNGLRYLKSKAMVAKRCANCKWILWNLKQTHKSAPCLAVPRHSDQGAL